MNLTELLEARLFPFISRPARYIGNEWGAVHKTEPVSLHLALAVPDKYDRAMALPELHRLYRFLNDQPAVACERVFAPDIDAEQRLRREQIPLFTLETFTSLCDVDWIHFLLTDPLQFTAIMVMIETAGLPLSSAQRELPLPLISASLPEPLNPEPVAEWFDFIFLGDFDAEWPRLQRLTGAAKATERKRLLADLTQVPGVYVPAFYAPVVDSRGYGSVTARESTPARIRAQRTAATSIQLATVPIIAYEEVAIERLQVQLRSSVEPAATVEFVGRALAETGLDEVALSGDLNAGIKNLDSLLIQLVAALRDRKVTITLPPLPAHPQSLEWQRAVSMGDKSGLRFDLISGGERLREAHGHFAALENFYQLVANAFAGGWRSIRLEFKIGLPDEDEQDLEDTISAIRNCDSIRAEYGDRCFLHITLAPYSIRPGSEWQWEALLPPAEYQRRAEMIERRARGRNIQFKVRDYSTAWLRQLLSRGDRRMSGLIQRAKELGARFDGWNEHINLELWQQAASETDHALQTLAEAAAPARHLPWEHLEFDAGKEQLLKLRQNAFPPQSPRRGGGFKLGDIMLARPELMEQIVAAPEPPAIASSGFGRRPKRVIEKSASMIVPRSRVRLQWQKDESVRFVGHLATLKMFERALRRAEWPVSFSQGQHPRPKLSFGPPLTLGYTSLAEYVDIQLETPYSDALLSRLNRSLPDGFRVLQGRTVFGKAAALSSQINAAEYAIDITESANIDQNVVNNLLDRSALLVKRVKGDEVTEADVRSAVRAATIMDDGARRRLVLELALGNLGFARPDEILAAGFALGSAEILSLKICRTALIVVLGGNRLSPFEVSG